MGNIFTVNVLINTEGAEINNAESTINFPSDLLEIISVSKSGSIFSLWVEEPNFSNDSGAVSFNGGLPTPGYNGSAGKVLSVVFRAKNEGSASIVFSSAAIRANDGYGTDVFRGAGQATFNLTSKEKAPPAEVSPAPPAAGTKVPAAPKVTSITHPDPTKWYSNNNPTFEWQLSRDITGVNVLADRNPNSNPGTKSDGMRTSYTFNDVDEGEWYFHIRLRNSVGWGAITHFGFNIDKTPPVDLMAFFTDNDPANTQPIINLSATDTISGIDYYEIYANNTSSTWRDDGTGQYQLNTLPAGEQKMHITVFDKAGNGKSTELFRNVVLPAEMPKVSKVSAWSKVCAWVQSNILWIIIILLYILLTAIIIYNTIYLRTLFGKKKKKKRKPKRVLYASSQKIAALQKEILWHAEAIKKLTRKRKLRWRERRLRRKLLKLSSQIKKYLSK